MKEALMIKADLIHQMEWELRQLREQFVTDAREAARSVEAAADRLEQNGSDPNPLGVLQGRMSQLDALAGRIKESKKALAYVRALEG